MKHQSSYDRIVLYSTSLFRDSPAHLHDVMCVSSRPSILHTENEVPAVTPYI